MTANPSIERTQSGLRPPCAAQVKRQASKTLEHPDAFAKRIWGCPRSISLCVYWLAKRGVLHAWF